jgi:hypothetical protein
MLHHHTICCYCWCYCSYCRPIPIRSDSTPSYANKFLSVHTFAQMLYRKFVMTSQRPQDARGAKLGLSDPRPTYFSETIKNGVKQNSSHSPYDCLSQIRVISHTNAILSNSLPSRTPSGKTAHTVHTTAFHKYVSSRTLTLYIEIHYRTV